MIIKPTFIAAVAVMLSGTAYASDSALKELKSSVSPSVQEAAPQLPVTPSARVKQTAADAPAFDSINSAIVNMIFDIHGTKIDQADLKKFPNGLVCTDDSHITNTGSGNSSYDFSSALTDKNKVGLVFNWSDGDQVAGLYLLRSDLEALAAKRVTSIPAKAIGGFWWSDGDHYSISDTVCRMP